MQVRVYFVVMVAAVAFTAAPGKAAGAYFDADGYSATLSGSAEGAALVFGLDGTKSSCNKGTFSGTLGEPAEALSSTAALSECTAFGFVGATVITTGCEFVLHAGEEVSEDKFNGSVDLTCESGKKIVIVASVLGSTCEVQIGPQSGLKALELTNHPEASPQDFTSTLALVKMKYTKTKDTSLCPLTGTGTKEDGTFNATVTMKGSKAGNAVGAQVRRGTKLCKVAERICGAGNTYGTGTFLEAESSNAKLVLKAANPLVEVDQTIQCGESVITGTTSEPVGQPRLKASIETVSFSTCTLGGNACSLAPRSLSWPGEFTSTKPNEGRGILYMNAEVRLICNADQINCDYGGSPTASVTGGNPANWALTAPQWLAREPRAGEEGCRAVAEIGGTYSQLKPKPSYVTL